MRMPGIQFTEKTKARTKAILSGPKTIVQDEKTIQQVYEEVVSSPQYFGFDLETSGLRVQFGDEIIGVGLCSERGYSYYLPTGHREIHDLFSKCGYKNLRWEPVQELLTALLRPEADRAPCPVGHNVIKFDLPFVQVRGVPRVTRAQDTMLLAFVMDERRANRPQALRLKSSTKGMGLAGEVLKVIPEGVDHIEAWKRQNKQGLATGQVSFANCPIEMMGYYGCEDTQLTLAAWFELLSWSDATQRNAYKTERDLAFVLQRMEQVGMPVHVPDLLQKQGECQGQVAKYRAECVYLAGRSFNPDSDQQTREVLYAHLRLPEPDLRTKKDLPSVAIKAIQSIEHPIIDPLIQFSEWTKAGEFVDSLCKLQRNGTVVSDIRQTSTRTSRLSSTTPNLQNLPAKGFRRELVRGCFRPRPGYWFLCCDYSQIELRLLVHFMQDQELIDKVWSGIDLHAMNGERLYGKPASEITPDERKRTKAIVFGLLYGMGVSRLARDTGMTLKEAKAFVERFFTQFPALRKLINRLQAQCREQGGIWNPYGYFRHLDEDEVRLSLNTFIQGTAAAVMKKGMIATDKYLLESGVTSRLIMTIHDELMLEWNPEELQVPWRVLDAMQEESGSFSVPLWADMAVGKGSWDGVKGRKVVECLKQMRTHMEGLVERRIGKPPSDKTLGCVAVAAREQGKKLLDALDYIESTRLNLTNYLKVLRKVEQLWTAAA